MLNLDYDFISKGTFKFGIRFRLGCEVETRVQVNHIAADFSQSEIILGRGDLGRVLVEVHNRFES
jgi:hypothetical protein